MARLLQASLGVAHEVHVLRVLGQHALHAFEHVGVDVAGDLAKVGRYLAFHLRAVHHMALVVDLLDNPHMAGDGNLLAGRRRLHNRAELHGLAAAGVLLVVLERRIELVGARDALAGETHDETALIGALDVVDVHEVAQEHPIVVGRDVVEARQVEHLVGELSGTHLAARGKRGHGLVIEQAEGHAPRARRLDPAFLQVHLHKGDALHKLPGDALGHEGARLRLLLAHDEPHLARPLAAAGAAHALQKTAHRERRVYLEGPFEPADVDAELKGGGCHGGEHAVVIAHGVLSAFAQRRGEVAMVDEEAVGLAGGLAILAQACGDGLGLFARVDKDQALGVFGVLEDVGDTGVGVLGRHVAGGLKRRSCGSGRLAYLCAGMGPALHRLGAAHKEMLHGETPGAPLLLDLRDDAAPACTARENLARELGVADGSRQADAAGVDARHAREALDAAQRLPAAVAAQKRMHLVDHHKTQVAEKPGHSRMLVHEQRFERLGRNLQDTRGVLEHARLVRGAHVAVPVPHGDARLSAQVVQTVELVVDECLERAHVDSAHRCRRVLVKERENRKERRLSFARSRGRRQEHVVVGVEDGVAGGHLNAAQRLPAVRVDEILDERRVAVENVQGSRLDGELCERARRRNRLGRHALGARRLGGGRLDHLVIQRG